MQGETGQVGRCVGGPECQGQSDSLLTPNIHLVTKSRARRLPPMSVRNLSPLHWLALTVVHSQPCSLGPLQLLTICCLSVAPSSDRLLHIVAKPKLNQSGSSTQ